MDKLSQQELTRIRRGAEDAIQAMNRNHKSFIEAVSHPLNIIALVDMAQASIGQKAKVEGLQKQLIDQGQRFNVQAQRVKDLEYKNGELQKLVDAFKDHAAMLRKAAKSYAYTEREQNILLSQADDIEKILGLEQALKGEQ